MKISINLFRWTAVISLTLITAHLPTFFSASASPEVPGLIKDIFPGAGSSVTLINGAPPPQPPGDIEWLRQFGGFAPAFNNLARAVDADGSVYIAGQVRGALPGQTSVGGDDAFVRKYDAAGNEVWTHQFGSGVYVCGFTAGALAGQTTPTPSPSVSLWSGFGTTGQLSLESGIPSCRSCLDLECAELPNRRRVRERIKVLSSAMEWCADRACASGGNDNPRR